MEKLGVNREIFPRFLLFMTEKGMFMTMCDEYAQRKKMTAHRLLRLFYMGQFDRKSIQREYTLCYDKIICRKQVQNPGLSWDF